MWTKNFWESVADRAIRSAAQGMIATIPTTATILHEVDWLLVLSGGVMMGIMSVLTSIAWHPKEIKLTARMQVLEQQLQTIEGSGEQ